MTHRVHANRAKGNQLPRKSAKFTGKRSAPADPDHGLSALSEESPPDDFATLNVPATPEQFAHVVGTFMAGLPAYAAVIATRCWYRQDAADREGYLTMAVRAFARGQGDDDSREERAAILEFDGGLPRQHADQVANVRRRRA